MTWRAPVAIVLALAVAAAAYLATRPGSPSASAQVRSAQASYDRAVYLGDSTTACGLLTPESQDQAVAASQSSGSSSFVAAACTAAFASSYGSPTERRDLWTARVGPVSFSPDGKSATVQLQGATTTTAHWVRVDGRWLLDLAGG
jgi:hypothetical protein